MRWRGGKVDKWREAEPEMWMAVAGEGEGWALHAVVAQQGQWDGAQQPGAYAGTDSAPNLPPGGRIPLALGKD